MSNGQNNHRFLALDGLRGVAAALVVQRHDQELFGSPLGHSYLAVDLFFWLSGFVIVAAYEEKMLRHQLSFQGFMRARLIRLYPLYLCGLIIATANSSLKLYFGYIDVSWIAFLGWIITGLLFLPAISPEVSAYPFPLIGAAWSLFWEIIVNVIFGLIVKQLRTLILLIITAIGFGSLIYVSQSYGSIENGGLWSNLLAGGARALFCFFGGILLYRLRPAAINLAWMGWPSMAIMVALLLMPIPLQFKNAYEMFAVSIGFPLTVFLGSYAFPRPVSVRVMNNMGAISYALYVLHQPMLGIIRSALAIMHIGLTSASTPFCVAIFIIMLMISYAADIYYDMPVRAYLARKCGREAPGGVDAPRLAHPF